MLAYVDNQASMTSGGEQSFVVDVWLSVDESVREAIRDDFERLLGIFSSSEQAKPALLAMPSITEEPSPGGGVSAVRLRWVDMRGSNPFDAAAEVINLFGWMSQSFPVLGSGDIQVRAAQDKDA